MLVATNLFGRGMDIERVNIVFNYDMPDDSDTYLHRVSEIFPGLIVSPYSCGSVLPGFNLWRQFVWVVRALCLNLGGTKVNQPLECLKFFGVTGSCIWNC